MMLSSHTGIPDTSDHVYNNVMGKHICWMYIIVRFDIYLVGESVVVKEFIGEDESCGKETHFGSN